MDRLTHNGWHEITIFNLQRAEHALALLHITAFLSLSPGGPSFKPTEVLGRTYFLRSLRSFAAIPAFVLTFAPLADVAKGGDGAESALREI